MPGASIRAASLDRPRIRLLLESAFTNAHPTLRLFTMAQRKPLAPLEAGWVIVDGRPVFHRINVAADEDSGAIVHVHGFGISGTYLEPTAALLASRHRTYVPDLPGMGRSARPQQPLDLPGLAAALMSYCDAVGVERATFVANSLGCPILVEVASAFPQRIERAVLVSPAGGANNQPMTRAIRQMSVDGLREPLSMLPIAVRDYLRFGVLRSLSLFNAMCAYPALDRLPNLTAPTLVVVGERDPLIRIDRLHLLAVLPHVDIVTVPGAHALNYSAPRLISELVEAHMSGAALRTPTGPRSAVRVLGRATDHGDRFIGD